MENVVKAGGIVIYRCNPVVQFLLLQTSYGQHHWTPPKGHCDPGEDLKTAAIRETEEEAGLKETHYHIDPNITKTLEYMAHGKPKSVTYWIAELKNNNEKIKLSEEHQKYLWCNCSEACELVEFEEMKKLLVDVNNFIGFKHGDQEPMH